MLFSMVCYVPVLVQSMNVVISILPLNNAQI